METKETQGLSLPVPEGTKRAKMPWEKRVLCTVETPEGDLMSLDEEQLTQYASGAGAKKTEP